MSGFCRSMREESNIQIKEYMLDYVINLLEDVNDFSWASAKASHAVFALLNGAGGGCRLD